ncbi:MAG: CCA tRNA nucleotidyltransferase [Stomatobaculum sp.]|nr:CCA tRNA nucleotidyltransferase [Stomatobaculum sp.]
MQIPQQVKQILETLTQAGFQAYAVGGCVRDFCLGREPEDWDITTDALPEEVKCLFRRTVDTGIRHGTVTVLVKDKSYEITTFRVDGTYSDGRHPDSVEFTPDLSEDLKRRDFTINAMACGADGSITDLFGGREDLQLRKIRCVGDPGERFTEDALRILRAVRFSAQLSFDIEEATWEALKAHAPNLVNVSRERVLAELNKMILSPHPEKMALLSEAGIIPWVGKELERLLPSPQIAELPVKKDLRWAAAFAGTEGETARTFLKNLKSDNETADGAALLISGIREPVPDDLYGTRRLLSVYGQERVREMILLWRAGFGVPVSGEQLDRLEERISQILSAGDCLAVRDLALSGNDLIRLGIRPGPELGRILAILLEHVLKYPEQNTAECLEKMAREEDDRSSVSGGKSGKNDASK